VLELLHLLRLRRSPWAVKVLGYVLDDREEDSDQDGGDAESGADALTDAPEPATPPVAALRSPPDTAPHPGAARRVASPPGSPPASGALRDAWGVGGGARPMKIVGLVRPPARRRRAPEARGAGCAIRGLNARCNANRLWSTCRPRTAG